MQCMEIRLEHDVAEKLNEQDISSVAQHTAALRRDTVNIIPYLTVRLAVYTPWEKQ